VGLWPNLEQARTQVQLRRCWLPPQQAEARLLLTEARATFSRYDLALDLAQSADLARRLGLGDG